MAGRTPEENVVFPVMLQGWKHVGFLHWRVDPAAVQRLLPEPLQPHLHDGAAWVSLTPFLVEAFHITRFPETNLRTYVVGPDGKDGLWFISIEAGSLPTTLGARALYGAPYRRVDMSVDAGDGKTRYRSRSHDIVLAPGEPIEGDELDHWLTGRWRAYTRHPAGGILQARVQHQPWPLHRAEVIELEETLTADAGLPRLGPPDRVHWSPGVDTRLSRPHRG